MLSSLKIICSLGQVTLSLDKYLMTIYLSLGKYQLLLFPHSWLIYREKVSEYDQGIPQSQTADQPMTP